MNYDVGVFTRRRIISPAESYFAVPAAASGAYVGPSDIVSGWVAWYGMRAFSAASAATGTQKAFNLRFNDAVSKDYFTQLNGTVDLTSYASDLGIHGAPVNVNTWYDQSGNGHDLDFTIGTLPVFTLSALSGFPAVTFSGAQSGTSIGSTITLTAPLSFSTVVRVTGTGGQIFGTDNATAITQCAVDGTPATHWFGYAGGAAGEELFGITSGSFHAAQFTLISGSGHTYIDGVDSNLGAAIGTAAFSASKFRVAANNAGAGFLIGDMIEIGLLNGSLFAVQGAMNSNQHSVYSF